MLYFDRSNTGMGIKVIIKKYGICYGLRFSFDGRFTYKDEDWPLFGKRNYERDVSNIKYWFIPFVCFYKLQMKDLSS